MVSADHYRVLAADCDARAKNERVSTQRGEWEQLARAYRHLASQADRNQLNDIVYAPALFDDPHRSKGPVQAVRARISMAATELGTALENLTVLIADGNSYSRRLTRTMLMNVGAKLNYEVGDGAAALQAIRDLNPDVMILEWDMPVMDGREVMRIVRSPAEFPKPNLPVIMLSDSGHRSRLDMAVHLGVHEFLVKPVSSKTLQQRLFGIMLKPRPMVHAEGRYIPLPRQFADRDASGGTPRLSRSSS